MTNIWMVFLGIIGASFGSFAGVLVWRMKRNSDVDKLTTKSSTKKLSWINGRSICESCEHKLSAFDLIPIFSWIFLRGKCRYCHKKIGVTTLLLEIGMATAFVISFLFWPFGWPVVAIALFVIWLLIVVIMTTLLVYDAKWHLLPNKLILPLVILATAFTVICNLVIKQMNFMDFATLIFYGMLPITGIYGALWTFSRGKWVGLGDVKLGVAIGLLVGWQGGLIVLVMSNCLGTLAMIPMLFAQKVKMKTQIAFGPFLIIATFIVVIFGEIITKFLRETLFLF